MARFTMPVTAVRSALKAFKSSTAEIASQAPSWNRVLTVRDHEGALDPGRALVIGDRGTGKSFWTGALLSLEGRNRLATVYPRLALDRLDVSLGFGSDEFTAEHPVAGELVSLMASGFEPEAIWRAVILASAPDGLVPIDLIGKDWKSRVEWVAEDLALRRDYFVTLDRALSAQGRRLLVIFDALDTLAAKWDDIARLMRGLLQASLFLRSSKTIFVKLFLRPDMADDPTLWAVGDSSKLRYDEVTLVWARKDLYGLLIQSLANHDATGSSVAQYVRERFSVDLSNRSDRFEVPEQLLESEIEQQKFFALIAGNFMGANATKGRTYTWVPNHLANARGYAAPRSFLYALAVAAENSKNAATALDVGGIQEGVRQASKIRMSELREDYRWIDAIFRPLKDMLVPVERSEFLKRWSDQKVVTSVYREMDKDQSGRYLPPPRVSTRLDDTSTHAALIETLDHLAIAETTADGRLNMPDLFRLAAGVKRKGGVRLRP
jgi:hypothetical protein